MAPEEIINQKTKHLDWQTIKETNPEEYLRLSKEAILTKFNLVYPYYLQWQKKTEEFCRYMDTLPSIQETLESMNFDVYDTGLEGKRILTELFYEKILSYGVESILECASNYDSITLLKIKNLINRCFKNYYLWRKKISKNIEQILQLNESEIESIPLFAYLPFCNMQIGIDWMLRRNSPTLSDLLYDWIILLCFDFDKFFSRKFLNELAENLNEDNVDRLLQKLLIYIAREEKNNDMYRKIHKIYGETITQYRKALNKGTIIEDITFQDLRFRRDFVYYYGYYMPIQPELTDSQVSYLSKKIDKCRDLTIFISHTPQKGIYRFQPIFARDFEYLMACIKEARSKASIIQDKPGVQINKSLATSIAPSAKQVKGNIDREGLESNHNSVVDDWRILASDISASQLKIRKTVIEYKHEGKKYHLRSVRIENKVSPSILEKIDHKFTLVKGRYITKDNKTELRFHFEPANDLSFLLAEINRLSDPKAMPLDVSYPMTGEFDIPWRNVRFFDGILMLFHPNPSKRGTITPFYFRNSDILKTFEDIRPYIEKRCCKLRVVAVDGVIITLKNFKEFLKHIIQYKEWEKEENIRIGKPINKLRNTSIPKDVFSINSEVKKSPYLSLLSTLQHSDYKIIYLLERVIHEIGLVDTDEYGYLFVLKKIEKKMILLYENITDSSRSSLMFFIKPEFYEEAVDHIKKFLAGNIKNKRQKIAYGQIYFDSALILAVKRIKHTNITDWKYALYHYL